MGLQILNKFIQNYRRHHQVLLPEEGKGSHIKPDTVLESGYIILNMWHLNQKENKEITHQENKGVGAFLAEDG